MHAWPVHTTKSVAVHEASSYATCRLEQLEKPVEHTELNASKVRSILKYS